MQAITLKQTIVPLNTMYTQKTIVLYLNIITENTFFYQSYICLLNTSLTYVVKMMVL